MNRPTTDSASIESPQGFFRGVILIVLVGTALGLGYNAMGLVSQPSWGLSWIAVDRVSELASFEVEPVTPETMSTGG